MLTLLLACSDSKPPADLVEGAATEALYVHTDSMLYTWSPEGGLAEVGYFADAAGNGIGMVTDIAIATDGQLYAGASQSIYKVDARDATVEAWVSLSDNATGMTVLPDDHLLVAGSTLTSVDRETGEAAPFSTTTAYTTSGDVVGVPDGSVHWSVRGGAGDQWVRVDPASGETELLGDVGASELWGVAYAWDTLYAFSSNGSVYAVDDTTGAGTSVATEAVSFYGATTNPGVW
jgi:hypothetical protein